MTTENKYQKSIDRLNQAIGKEIATTLQYLYFHVHFEDDGYEYFSKMMKQTSITEMFHTDRDGEHAQLRRAIPRPAIDRPQQGNY